MTPVMKKAMCPNCQKETAEQFGQVLQCHKCNEGFAWDEKSNGWLPTGQLEEKSAEKPIEELDTKADEQPKVASAFQQMLDDWL